MIESIASHARAIETRPLGVRGVSFLEFELGPERGVTEAIRQDAYLVTLQLEERVTFNLFADGRYVDSDPCAAGKVSLYDMRQNLAVEMLDRSRTVDLFLPHSLLRAIKDEPGMSQAGDADIETGQAIDDTVMRDLFLAMRPALANRTQEALPLFVDHVATAMAVHIATRYGSQRQIRRVTRGGLAAWQERRTKELLGANLHGRLSLEDLARECRLSVRHFTRAFRQSTGSSPYEWLAFQRIEKAKGLLRYSRSTLAEIAATCGFADQSHLSRAFSEAVGTSPGAWRRHQGVVPKVSDSGATVAPLNESRIAPQEARRP